MKFYFAPMEGVTGYVYRNAYHAYFHKMDKYFAPFIAAGQRNDLKARDLKDILPENNEGLTLVPQLLTNRAEDFINTSRQLKELGYSEINFNLGCPSGTVVSKSKGSGFLAKTTALQEFLEEVFAAGVTEISVKTRLGKDQPEEFYEIIEIFNQFPIKELIIHPRVQKDMYNNKPNRGMFEEALRLSKNPVCYNGDIFSVQDYRKFTTDLPEVDTIMLGRGLVSNPGLVDQITENKPLDKTLMKEFHNRIYENYQSVLSGERNVLFKMKEIWSYLCSSFTEPEKYVKKIKKAERLKSYEEAIECLFHEQEIKGYN